MWKMRVAVIGGGISGLVSAYILAKNGVEVVLYEKEDHLGGHAKTLTIDGLDLDLGFMVFNTVTCPNMVEWFESLAVDMQRLDMSFSKKNLVNPSFRKMLREIFKFKDDVISYLEILENNMDIVRNETLGQFVTSHGYSELFQEAYLPFGSPQWLAIKGQSCYLVNKVREELESRGCRIRTRCEVHKIEQMMRVSCIVLSGDGSEEVYSGCILAVHAPDAVRILAEQVTPDELRVLGAFQYVHSDIFLHHDENLMPRNQATWSALNFIGSTDNKVCLTYWLNVLQNIGETSLPFLATVNPENPPKHTLLKWSTGHPVPSIAASKALLELHHIQGKRGILFSGAYQCYGFHEDELKAGISSAHGILGESCALLSNPKHMVPSLVETGAQRFVTRFLRHFISNGCLILLEEGGTIFTFGKTTKRCSIKTVLKVHNPQFYWKIFVANRDVNRSVSKATKKSSRGWWTPLLLTASISSAIYFFQHVSRQNTLTQARRNISCHYDLSNELFALFLGETMQYSCGIFKTKDEDLNSAQRRKIFTLIEKARIQKKHEVLEIGCGWGVFAIELVKQTGCKYTGITLSEEQLKFGEKKVADAEHVGSLTNYFVRCTSNFYFETIANCPIHLNSTESYLGKQHIYDLPSNFHQQSNNTSNFFSQMLEHVGHDNMNDFFGCCESILAEDGIFVLQFTSLRDERYEEHIRSSDFIKEYIFPGACIPSLSRVTSAMVAASRFDCVFTPWKCYSTWQSIKGCR
ncbi:hypothetical protein FEM48_Zijuj07G0093100 [Ziziphus jujuba var. spinosa]|uniref:Tuberculostearic acid methyltransferase UfaA1-like n=1 Tax=Ziziphus jujuba var. spinosa TaxID=714518 RepID=A0A978V3T2_ZIZJJ|nr:hypothetical protein FEM48_Zijuj07G0093100 [Ziziphus jujuba var. spinosa]